MKNWIEIVNVFGIKSGDVLEFPYPYNLKILVLEHLGVGRYKILYKGIVGVISTGKVFWDLIVGDNE